MIVKNTLQINKEVCFADNILGSKLDIHGAQVHHAEGSVCAGDRAVPAAADPSVCGGRDDGATEPGG